MKHKLGKGLPEEISDAPAFVLIETSGGNKEHDEAVSLLPTQQPGVIDRRC
jgi:hypothetical protein